MVMRRCPQCGTTTDDQYGFCIRCGYEYPKVENSNEHPANSKCINCGFENPEEAKFCVKCGMPLIFNQAFENNSNPFIIKYETSKKTEDLGDYKKTSRLIIALGYIFSILGGLIGLIIALYLATRKDPVARKHGRIQLGILVFYLILIGIFIATGTVTLNEISNITSMQSFPMNF